MHSSGRKDGYSIRSYLQPLSARPWSWREPAPTLKDPSGPLPRPRPPQPRHPLRPRHPRLPTTNRPRPSPCL